MATNVLYPSCVPKMYEKPLACIIQTNEGNDRFSWYVKCCCCADSSYLATVVIVLNFLSRGCRQSSLSLQKHWPQVQFDNNMSETDRYWTPTKRETWQDVGERIQAFLTWLCQQHRHAQCIVVVSHGVWIETCLGIYSPGALGDKRVHNCDAYATTLQSQNGKVLGLSNVRLIA